MNPGNRLVEDEAMSAWKGQEGKYSATGISHATKIQRKPEGMGLRSNAVVMGTRTSCYRSTLWKARKPNVQRNSTI